MENKNIEAVFALCKCAIHIYDVLYKTTLSQKKKIDVEHEEGVSDDPVFNQSNHGFEFVTIFNALLSTVKILFRLSKDKINDNQFIKHNLIDDCLVILNDYYLEGESYLLELTVKVISNAKRKVEISNIDSVFDLLIYTTGLLKFISTNDDINPVLQEKKAITLLTKIGKKVLS